MNIAVRTTVVFSLVSGLLYLPLAWGLGSRWLYPSSSHLVLWGLLAIYAVLLARWSHTRVAAIIFPLLLLLVMVFLPGMRNGFTVMALAILSWIRTGICFQGKPLRGLVAELGTVAGGVTLVLLLTGPSPLSWSLGLILFGLLQSLYFFVVPMDSQEAPEKPPRDLFEHAFQEAEKIIGTH